MHWLCDWNWASTEDCKFLDPLFHPQVPKLTRSCHNNHDGTLSIPTGQTTRVSDNLSPVWIASAIASRHAPHRNSPVTPRMYSRTTHTAPAETPSKMVFADDVLLLWIVRFLTLSYAQLVSASFYPNLTTLRSGICCRKSVHLLSVCHQSVTLLSQLKFSAIFSRHFVP